MGSQRVSLATKTIHEITRSFVYFSELIIPVVCVLAMAALVSAHPASGIVIDRKGQVFFSDLETVWRLGLDGKLSVFRAGVSGRHVHELSIDQGDNIYGADISYEPAMKKFINAVWKMSPEGGLTWLLAPTDGPQSGMSIWRDRAGNMYLVDQNNHLKQKTLLLRRTPAGSVEVFAGGAYGHRDGKGREARFASIGGMAFGPDGSLFLTDGDSVRKVAMDGTVTTIANNLNFTTVDDKPRQFGGNYGSLAGIAVDSNNTYVADSGNRRLLMIDAKGKVNVTSRPEEPYYPTGVAIDASGNVYVLEIGFIPPKTYVGPRVRKISHDGGSSIIAQVGNENPIRPEQRVEPTSPAVLTSNRRNAQTMFVIGMVVLTASFIPIAAFKLRRKQRCG